MTVTVLLYVFASSKGKKLTTRYSRLNALREESSALLLLLVLVDVFYINNLLFGSSINPPVGVAASDMATCAFGRVCPFHVSRTPWLAIVVDIVARTHARTQ